MEPDEVICGLEGLFNRLRLYPEDALPHELTALTEAIRLLEEKK